MNQREAEDLSLVTGGHGTGSAGVHASEVPRRQRELMGEYELVEAILRAAIRDYQELAVLQTRRGERSFREIENWFLADDREWHFSFVNLCQILDLEPKYIRTGLKIWRERLQEQYPNHSQGHYINRQNVAVQKSRGRRDSLKNG